VAVDGGAQFSGEFVSHLAAKATSSDHEYLGDALLDA
jgi:hypothetical protein